jgi:hypothetical protein
MYLASRSRRSRSCSGTRTVASRSKPKPLLDFSVPVRGLGVEAESVDHQGELANERDPAGCRTERGGDRPGHGPSWRNRESAARGRVRPPAPVDRRAPAQTSGSASETALSPDAGRQLRVTVSW